jgi:hypothetical protein
MAGRGLPSCALAGEPRIVNAGHRELPRRKKSLGSDGDDSDF